MAPDRSKAGGNRNRPDVLTDPRAIQRVHLDHHQISSHQNVVKTIQDTPITDLKDVEVDKTSDDFAAGQSLVWGGDSWIAGDPEILIPVKAAEEMTKGTPVYVSDEQASGKPIVSKADSDGTDTYPAIGLLFTDLASGEEGHAVGGGIISGLDTSGYAVGDALYLSSTPGVLTNTRPTATAEKVQKVALVARSHPEAGSVIVMGAGRTNDIPNDLVTLTGVPLGNPDLDKFDDYTYPGPPSVVYETVIPDDTDIKTALQSLSTEAGRLMAEIVFNVGEINTLKSNTATLFHGRYNTEAEARRDDNDAALTKTEIYYTARPDGDGYAESEVTASTPAGAVIERRLFYSDKFDADVNTPADWTAYTTQPADDTAFATAKASLLAGLSDTDGTANTRGTLPLSLKMEHTFVTDKLLNDYPALAGFSVRLIRFGYSGNCLKVRRSSDNSELDIGFDSNGDLDISAIETHCGSSDGFVSVWYDQSGNGNNVTQGVTSLQPKIYDGSAVVQDNGRPAIQAISASNYLRWPGTIITGTGARSMLCVANADSAVNDNFLTLSSASTGNGSQWNWTPEVRIRVIGDRRYDNNPMDTQTIGMLTFPAGGDTTDIDFYENGTQATVSTVTTAYAINTGTSGFAYMHSTLGKMQEMVLWTSDQDSNVTGINNDADTYYDATNTTAFVRQFSGAAAAYSVRCLTSLGFASVCMKVRRDSDNATQNIGFDSNGDLDTAAIATFCGAANGYVAVWYDQSGNGNHGTQGTAANQPLIYNGTAVITKNGRPAAQFDGTNDNIELPDAVLPSTIETCSAFTVQANTNGISFQLGDETSAARWYQSYVTSGTEWAGYATSVTAINLGSSSSSQKLITAIAGSTQGNYQAFVNGTSKGSQTLSTNAPLSGRGEISRPALPMTGTFQEVIIYHSDESTNRTGIESDINTYYEVTTSFIGQFSGAAAAYSVRCLTAVSSAALCMKVRRDSDDTTQDIGFDSSGDLDTAAIKSFCDDGGAGTLGYVDTWYDQSGNGNDAAQSTTTQQPQIYNGTAVLTENGKACAQWDGSDDLMAFTTTASVNNALIVSSSSDDAAIHIGTVSESGVLSLMQDGATGTAICSYGSSAKFYADGTLACTNGVQTRDDMHTAFSTGSQVLMFVDDVSVPADDYTIGTYAGSSFWLFAGKIQEVVLFSTDHGGNRTRIEGNVNTYFSVY